MTPRKKKNIRASFFFLKPSFSEFLFILTALLLRLCADGTQKCYSLIKNDVQKLKSGSESYFSQCTQSKRQK